MTDKKLAEVAEQIIKAELIIMGSDDKEEIKKAKKTITSISKENHWSLEDMIKIDVLVQKIICQKS